MLSDLFFQIANLKNISRTGWKAKLDLPTPESVADHSYMMTVMAMVLSDLRKTNTEKIMKMSLLHDWAEAKIGDFMPNEIAVKKKNELEDNAMKEILDLLPSVLKEEYNTIWNEYKQNSSTEAIIVHQLDKLEMALQAKIYGQKTKPEKIKPFIISAIEEITDKDLKKLLLEIIE